MYNADNFMKKVKNNKAVALSWWSVVKNLPANAGDMGSIPGPGRSNML